MWADDSFVGVLDLFPNAAAAFAIARKLRAAYAGALVRLRRASDDTESDFLALANGNLDTAAIAAFLSATAGFVTTLYDQSGNGKNATMATASKQPAYVASGPNGLPTMWFDGAVSSRQLVTADLALVQPDTIYVVAKQTNKATTARFLDSSSVARQLVGLEDTSGKVQVYAGNVLLGAVDRSGAYIVETCLFNGAASASYINGAADVAGDAGALGLGILQIGGQAGAYLTGNIDEVLIYPAAHSAANRQVLERNLGAYYAITVA
jgi:hypothetical protein